MTPFLRQSFRLLISTLFIASQPCFSLTHEGNPYFLEVGEQRSFPLPTLSHFSLSGVSVHHVRLPNENSLLIKAVSPGLSTLFVTLGNGESETHFIRVEQKKSIFPETLFQALNSVEGIHVVNGGSHYIFRGTVRTLELARTLSNIKEHFPKYVIDETEIDPDFLSHSKNELKRLLQNYPSLSLDEKEGSLFIHGALPSLLEKEALSKKIHSIQPLTSIEIETLKDLSPTLYFKIFLLEVKKEIVTKLGTEWPESHSGAIHFTPFAMNAGDSLDLTIHALTQKGLARILSNPELVVKTPGQAELFAGRELPIRAHSRFTDSVIWKNIGLSLKLDVKEYGGDRVRLSVETEMSHLDSHIKNDNIPGVQTNRIKTLVDAELGRPLLLSGLLQEDMYENTSGIPALSSLPVIGKLFASEDYQNHRSELVAVLLPHRDLPSHPLERISSHLPKGFLPVPRNFLSVDEIENKKADKNYPWNVL